MLSQPTRRCLFTAVSSVSSTTAASSSGGVSRELDASAVRRSAFAQPGLEGLRIAAYAPTEPGVPSSQRRLPVAIGHVVAQLSSLVFAVDFDDRLPPPAVSLGSRVYVAYEREDVDQTSQQGDGGVGGAPSRVFLVGGLVVRVNPNGTLGVLLDHNKVDLAVPPEKIAVTEGVCKFLNHPKYLRVVEWVRSAGLSETDDVESTACILYHRGWRAERLYLLEASDIRSMTHLSQSARMSLMEKAEWQRDHHRQMRNIHRERVKERDRRYMSAKYAGILSASVAFCGAFSLFGWNYRNYLTHQRSYQMRFAVKTLCKKVPPGSAATIGAPPAATGVETSMSSSAAHRMSKHVSRVVQERWIRQVFHRLDTAHPRIVVITGYFGCGKSSLCCTAIHDEGMAGVFVDVRNKEDTLRSVIKALGVPHVEACGDPLDFISEACYKAKSITNGKAPVIVLKLREGNSLTRVYNEALTLACDRRACHIVVELPLESLTTTNTLLPRLDFYTVPNFSRSQAYEYIQHRLDALGMEVFLDTVGTNSNDLDELLAAAHQHRVSATEYTNQKLLKAMRRLQTAWGDDAQLKAAVKRLAQLPYDEGQHEGLDDSSLSHPSLRDVIFYNSVQDVWLFKNQVLHTAASCLL
ncbi:putative tuzin [Leishmania infantum JPCM5]|uniref:Tuzin_-_putative n=2 Tax=Leishmania infantum TaxID=5671 RepID=A0A6L0WIZ4_LEIIN|nr:putative tuzin [Leishmania infantum JPCM5]CAC9451608.1 tuzin_-_putative [Leishmania infantum]CAM65773.1 putative tuzin [Leishmania infantum JPCM5]SUZ39392.1 tuzin_-_putative [Leishmania infantum]|eukprot:XP_001463412.1 putative tuzin [Leishmania infantum JPCM5]